MKFFLVLVVVLAVVWLLGAPGRRLRGRSEARPAAAPPPLQDSIVACPQCDLHLPQGDAVPGRGGYFCCETHRSVHERAHPPG